MPPSVDQLATGITTGHGENVRHYNEVRPHSSIDYLTPNEFRTKNLTTHGAALLT